MVDCLRDAKIMPGIKVDKVIPFHSSLEVDIIFSLFTPKIYIISKVALGFALFATNTHFDLTTGFHFQPWEKYWVSYAWNKIQGWGAMI